MLNLQGLPLTSKGEIDKYDSQGQFIWWGLLTGGRKSGKVNTECGDLNLYTNHKPLNSSTEKLTWNFLQAVEILRVFSQSYNKSLFGRTPQRHGHWRWLHNGLSELTWRYNIFWHWVISHNQENEYFMNLIENYCMLLSKYVENKIEIKEQNKHLWKHLQSYLC